MSAIAIVALGSRGDVQPYIALARGLAATGHAPRLITHANYAPLAAAHGLDVAPVSGDVQQAAESPQMRAALASGNFLRIARVSAELGRSVATLWAGEALTAARGCDVLLAGIGGLFTALALAHKLDRPLINAPVLPLTPTAAFAGLLWPDAPRALYGVSHWLTRQALWQQARSGDNAARGVLGLPRAPLGGPYGDPRLRAAPTIYGYSPAVLPRPADWPAQTHVSGYWFLPAPPDWSPPPALAAFLDAGPPPVSIGFGSMTNRAPQETAALVLAAVRQSGQRAILLTGYDGLRPDDVPPHVYVAPSVPHDWLFARCAAVVHHGGAGTTAAGLRAGVPNVVVPYFGDQPFWGRRVAALGVGPAPLARRRLTAAALAQALTTAVGDGAMRARAAALGARIRAEDGVAAAVGVMAGVG